MEAARAAGFIHITFATQAPAKVACGPAGRSGGQQVPWSDRLVAARYAPHLTALTLPRRRRWRWSSASPPRCGGSATGAAGSRCSACRCPWSSSAVSASAVLGKTPLVEALARELATRGWHPGIVSRGYGRDAGHDEASPILVTPDADPAAVGDEPLLLARRGHRVAVARDRAAAGRALLSPRTRSAT